MIFNSLPFLIFLPVVFVGYWLIGRHVRLQNLFVVLTGLVFCGWYDVWAVVPLVIVGFWSFSAALLLEKHGKRGHCARWILALSLAVNLGALFYFKYFNFFYNSAVTVLSAMGFVVHDSTLKIILPIGISFYIFQTLGYVIDVARGSFKATHDVLAYFGFVVFFPRILAGPIDRAGNLLNQFVLPRSFSYPLAVDGCRQMLWGFFKKMVVADNCAALASAIFDHNPDSRGLAILLGALVYTIQIYGDFSGYSDIAIGCGKLFGIRLLNNFSFPYFARNIADFWRRWHISLTTWFRDYLYIPLGGSRVGILGKVRNTFIVFLASGLWHGANWTFILWGAFHAILFLPLILFGRNKKDAKPFMPALLGWFITFSVVAFGWMLFRAPDLLTFFMWTCQMAKIGGLSDLAGSYNLTSYPWWIFALCFIVEFINRESEHGLSRLPTSKFVRILIYVFIIYITVLYRGGQSEFIYFQF